MLETMYVRCTHCGYDNSPEYRFCGMCGASLSRPPVVTKTAEKEPVATSSNGGNGSEESVHGPSFLGLAEDPKVEFHYLYEDEQPRSHVGLVLFLLVTLGAAGFLGWQWRQGGFPFNKAGGGQTSQSASPSEVAPAQSDDQQTKNEKPMTGAGDVLPTAPEQKTDNANKPDTGSKAPEAAAENPDKAAKSESAAPSGSAGAGGETSSSESKPAEKTEEAKATPPAPVPEKPRTAKPSPRGKPAATDTAVATSPDADLELTGERYLYGNGLPQNCTRAESSLRTAATHGNSKAETVLGTMYATGHCVGRDLPTAYRWFARALHQEPQNSRISADLQVLWRQMTPQEKQLATTSGGQ